MATLIPIDTEICPRCYSPIIVDGDDRWSGYKCGNCSQLFAINLKYETNGFVTCPYCETEHRFGEPIVEKKGK